GVLGEEWCNGTGGAAANIGKHSDAGKIIRFENGRRRPAMHCHRLVKHAGLFRVLAQILEKRQAVDLFKGRSAGLDGVEQLAPSSIKQITDKDSGGSLRSWYVAP